MVLGSQNCHERANGTAYNNHANVAEYFGSDAIVET